MTKWLIVIILFASVNLWFAVHEAAAERRSCVRVISSTASLFTNGYKVLTSGHPIYYFKTNVPRKKGIFVINNGFEYDLENYKTTMQALAESGYETLVYNYRTQGASLKLSRELAIHHPRVHLSDLTSDLDELLNQLQIYEVVHMVGLSYGASVASEFSTTNVHRVASLIFISPLVEFDPTYLFLRRHPMGSFLVPQFTSAQEKLISAAADYSLYDYNFSVPVHLILAEREKSPLRQDQDSVWRNKLKNLPGSKTVISNAEHAIPSSNPLELAKELVNIATKSKNQ